MTPMSMDVSGLKGLHIPSSPDIFPLALGWWLVILCIIFFVVLIYFIIYSYTHSTHRYVLRKLRKIKKISNNNKMLREINELAKRVAIARFGRDKIAPMYEDEWITFMNSLLKKDVFSKEYIDLLHKNMYASKQEISDSWRKRILKDYEKWIKASLTKRQ